MISPSNTQLRKVYEDFRWIYTDLIISIASQGYCSITKASAMSDLKKKNLGFLADINGLFSSILACLHGEPLFPMYSFKVRNYIKHNNSNNDIEVSEEWTYLTEGIGICPLT
ncbi:hypothetical protein M514_18825 [Trichuris suis]|uniref:Uncharacterized protein n=1 Tax=Trichuris suis TaxID=68888 RepID=A0A085NHS6_9BILA|nr:hypothetical protein M514_18825 [Trichuris suis]